MLRNTACSGCATRSSPTGGTSTKWECAAAATTRTSLTITTTELPEFNPVRRGRKTFPLPEHIQHDEHLPEYNDQFTPVKNLKL